jgi:hypothetical protein
MVNISTTVRGHYDNDVCLWAIIIRRFCDSAALGCPWVLRARTQHDGSVRVQFLVSVIFHLCSLFLSFLLMHSSSIIFYLCILQPFSLMQDFFVILQVQINKGTHTCASRSRVSRCTMVSQALVAEMAIPF